MTDAASAVERAIAAERWLSLSTLAVAGARITPHALTIGNAVFGAGSQVALNGNELRVTRDGWRVDAFTRYRPLVYYAAFGPEDVFACLRLAVGSLFEFGAYDGEVIVLTDGQHATLTDGWPEPLRAMVRVQAVAGDDMLDWTLARYRAIGLGILQQHRPCLYLDTDMVCDGPIGGLLARLALAPTLQAAAENLLSRPEDWYGASLFAADGVTLQADLRGFSTGALGFAEPSMVRDLFTLVATMAESHAARSGQRDAFSCYDQPFANYAAVKLGGVGTGLIDRFLDNRHYWLQRPPARRGLAHFTGGTGAAAAKLAAMTAYVAALRQQPAR